jgi:predicted dinucleotide-binding enzyme
MKIGVVGSGRVGGTIGELWVKAGHEVMFSSLDLEHDKVLASQIGAGARAGTSREAAAFGEVLFIAVPYAALPQVGRDLGDALKGKIVLDASNPVPGRDGDMAVEARAKGTGIASPQFLPGARLVRAFNCVGAAYMKSEAHRAGAKLGIPLAADDPAALQVAVRLVDDAGFEPVVVGGLARAKDFDYGTPIFGSPRTAAEVRQILGIKP